MQALILVFARLVNHNSAADVVEFLSGMTLPTGILALQARGRGCSSHCLLLAVQCRLCS